ncbi:hypothetical protein Csa_020980 [Cucumis sativus]|uniref:Transmembrane protein n=1 Tax=Cucumis sativus TaxID=3659 RepID=A0A0A0KCY0_CUCSA|nr:hypothetical protein Csa_020980 [Cucumis sativus]
MAAVVRLALMSLILAGMFFIQLTAANVKEAPMVDTALFFGSKIGKEEAVQGPVVAEGPAIRRLGKHHFHTSVAGGRVLIGSLATAVFAIVFCYIRVTRKPNHVN